MVGTGDAMSPGDAGDGGLGRSPAPAVETAPVALLDEPLNYIFADHFRHRSVCALLRRFLGQGCAGRGEADDVARFLGRDLDLHHQDEEEDLFPALERRAHPEDALGPVLARLGEDHRRCSPLARVIAAALTVDDGRDPITLDDKARAAIRRYVDAERQHLAIENGIVLSIARVRLKPGDLANLSRSMKARRGLPCR